MLAVVLSLVAALSYGLGDFTGGIGSKRTSAWSVALVAQVAGAGAVLLASLFVEGQVGRDDVGWAVLAGVFNGIGTAFLYRGLAGGRMGVVAPVSGVGAAALPVLVGLLSGERPAPLVWLGIAAALPAIWLVTREPAERGFAPARSGLLDGVLAGLGFGGLFACLAQIPEEAGLVPLALNQAVGGGAILLIALGTGSPWVPRHRAALYGVGAGVLGGTATASFLAATQTGYLTIAAAITSLYPAITVVLAALVLRERVHRGQALGLALCGVAVALVALG